MALFGVAESPLDVEDWITATEIEPDLTMVFEAWSKDRSILPLYVKAAGLGHKAIMVTWEPWTPTPAGIPNADQGAPQPRWSHQSILAGVHDAYIDQFARDAKTFPGTVLLRWAHEMNGDWYPWHNDPVGYVAAWKYLRNRIRSQRGAWNVQMVWSPNLDLWRTAPADWLAKLLPYWPGPSAVDHVGCTMINFGGTKDYTVRSFADRLALVQSVFVRPVLAAEMNCALEVAAAWFEDLALWVASGTCPLSVVVLSQGTSRAGAGGGTGILDWSVADGHPRELAALRDLVTELHQPIP